LARIIAERLTRELGATFLVESRPGAGGAIGTQTVVRAPPDGSTLLFTSSSVSILPAVNPNLGFDPLHDLLPVSVVCDLPPVLLVRADPRFANLRELVAEARSAPGRLNYGSGGVGSANHLAGPLSPAWPAQTWSTFRMGEQRRASLPSMAAKSISSLR